MRKVLLTTLAICGALMLSCSPEKMPEGKPSSSTTTVDGDAISANMTSLSFTAEGGSESVTITSNFSWEVISTPTWITLSITSGSSGTTSVKITADSSTSTSARTGTITFGNSSTMVSISVSQNAASVSNEISSSVFSLSFVAAGESKSISVTSNFSWETISKPSWITISPSSGSSGTTSITVTASSSSSTSSRTGTISIGKSSSATVSISVSQTFMQAISSELFKVNGVNFKMMKVEGGNFEMVYTPTGLTDSLTAVSSFYIGETEVTQELWEAVMGTIPGYYYKGAQRPVHSVTWDDCQIFIKKLNSLTGKTFRLPTEVEWRFAACGGNNSKGFIYAGSDNIDDVALYEGNCVDGGGPNNVAIKKANEIGIYDMSGNVCEWCQLTDDRSYHVHIGGSCIDGEESCRTSGWRVWAYPSYATWYCGFRLALYLY